MPANLKSAFKYPLYSKTQILSNSNDSTSIKNPVFKHDVQNDFKISKSKIVDLPSFYKKSTNNNKLDDIIDYHNNMTDDNDTESISIEYDLINKVLKSPKCIQLLRTILLYNNNNNNNNSKNIVINTDDLTKYLILFGIFFIIYKTLF